MIEDIYEPLSLFRDRLANEHAGRAAALFEELVARAGIDADANQKLVTKITELNKSIKKDSATTSRWKALRMLLWLITALSAITALLYLQPILLAEITLPFTISPLIAILSLLTSTITTLVVTKKITPIIRTLIQNLAMLNDSLESTTNQAWQQMAPLNALYECSIPNTLVAQSVPRLAFDPWFAHGRLDELHNIFGFSPSFNKNKSILFSQSGVINGNPFVVAESLDYSMGTETYHGSLRISWQERETYTDSNGKVRTRWVTRHQTLHASVTKPAPHYTQNRFIIYGNEAAPKLHFSRTPSELSHLGNTFSDKRRKNRKMKKLEAFSRNLDDEYGFTMMANREFELLFHATDRSDEIEFRILFTPLAQSQMVTLLKDRETGFGDNFTFIKKGMINEVYPAHLRNIELNITPQYFHHYDLGAARKRFNAYNNDYFKALFFAMAPILSIPIYQQHRSHYDIYRDTYSRSPSYWSHEMIANHHGYKKFAHQDSITKNILKTESSPSMNATQQVKVTAHGFRGVKRVDYIRKFGGDGHWHNVPVEWTEYIPVQRTSDMIVREAQGLTSAELANVETTPQDLQEFFIHWQQAPQDTTLHHSLLSFLH